MSRHPFGWDYPAGAENDPNAPYNQDVPEAVCRCGHGYEGGKFYQSWLENLDPELSIDEQMPKECPACAGPDPDAAYEDERERRWMLMDAQQEEQTAREAWY